MKTGSRVVSRSSTKMRHTKLQRNKLWQWRKVTQKPAQISACSFITVFLWIGLALPALAADRVEVRAGAHRDFGRLVFEWPQPSGFEARITEGILTVQFDRAFDAEFDAAVSTLNAYISGAEQNQSQTAVRFPLKGSLVLRSSHYDTSVVLDLMRAGTAASPTSIEGPGVRVGEHGDFTRIVFDWPRKVQYSANRQDDRVTVSFSSAGAPDLSRFARNPPRLIRDATASKSGEGLGVTFQVTPGTGLRHFRDGNKVVVDVLKGDASTALSPPTAAATVPPETIRAESPAAQKPPPEVITQPAPEISLPSDAYQLRLEVSSLPTGVRLIFPWQNPIPAAVFQRAGYLWTVFDKPARSDFSALTADYSDRIITAEQLTNRHATILRFKIPEDRYVAASRDELDWVVEITETPTPPEHPLTIERELDVQGGVRVFVPAVDTGSRWDLRDPEVGDILAVVPIQTPGHGLAQERLFAEFHLLASAQGLIIQPLSERVDVEPRSNGVRIIGEDGLILSKGRLPERLGLQIEGDEEPDEDIHEVVDSTGQMIDYKTWRGDPSRSFRRNRTFKMSALTSAEEGARNLARWEVARFFFANEHPQETIGILSVVAAEDETAAIDPTFLLLRGATHFQLRRFEEATEDLGDRHLETEPHAALWRSALLAEQGKWRDAKQQYASGASVLKYYPPEHQAMFRLAAAEAAIMTNDATMLLVELEGINPSVLNDKLRTRSALFRGRMLEMLSDFEAADEQYALVVESGYRPHAAQAEFAQLKLHVRTGELTEEEQIKALERLRYKWRGGKLELEVLHELGRLYVDTRDPANGLKTMRRAITYFPDSARAPGIAHDMNQVFRDMFLEGAADKMSEVSALALYYEFRELTPAGSDGDEMIRILSDRLVTVDLLDQAAELLDHQVKFRLRGQKKSKVGAKLAVVYLLNQEPREALRAIRMSRYPRIDEVTEQERRHLEARSLAEIERRSEALGVLEGDTSEAAEQIRADVYWRAKDWSQAAERIEGLLERSLRDNELLPSERFQVMRLAVALALAGDRDGLDRVRDRFNDVMEPTPDSASFRILTSNVAQTNVTFRELASTIASVSTLETFMSSYKEKIEAGEDNALN